MSYAQEENQSRKVKVGERAQLIWWKRKILGEKYCTVRRVRLGSDFGDHGNCA